MRGIVILFGLFVVSALSSPASSSPFRLCKDQPIQHRTLYVQSVTVRGLGCWIQVQDTPFVFEGNRTAGNLPTLRPRGTARFAYVLQQPEEAATVVLVKERVMKLAPDAQGSFAPQPEAYPTNDVVLVRPPVLGNRCGDRLDYYGPIPGTRAGLVNLGDYNRYHEQERLAGIIPNAIPRSDQLRSFHFRYPIASQGRPDCRDTDDGPSKNRQEYAFKGLSDSAGSSKLSRYLSGSAYAANGFYSKLKVQNLYVNAVSVIQQDVASNSKYYIASFTADANQYTRTELTISNLESYRDGMHWPTTWQMDWLNVKVPR